MNAYVFPPVPPPQGATLDPTMAIALGCIGAVILLAFAVASVANLIAWLKKRKR